MARSVRDARAGCRGWVGGQRDLAAHVHRRAYLRREGPHHSCMFCLLLLSDMYIHIFIYIHNFMYVSYLCIPINIYLHIYTYMYVSYLYIPIHIYIHRTPRPNKSSKPFPGLFRHGVEHCLCRFWFLVCIDLLLRHTILPGSLLRVSPEGSQDGGPHVCTLLVRHVGSLG